VFLVFLLLGVIACAAGYLVIMKYLGDGGHPPVKALTFWWFTVCGVPVIMVLSGLCGAFIQVGGRAAPPGHCPCGYDLRGNESGTCPECGCEVIL
jgi:hypothetical protein